jgi:hypothetical protein
MNMKKFRFPYAVVGAAAQLAVTLPVFAADDGWFKPWGMM